MKKAVISLYIDVPLSRLFEGGPRLQLLQCYFPNTTWHSVISRLITTSTGSALKFVCPAPTRYML